MTDELTQALLNLDGKLESFRSAQHAHASAHQRFAEQEKTTTQLLGATKTAISAAEIVTSQTKSLAEEMTPLAKAIQDVNFPLRLSEMHLAVLTQASKTAALQGGIERGLNDLRSQMERTQEKLADDIYKVRTSIEKIGKRESTIKVLCLINMAILVGLGALVLAPSTRVWIITAADAVSRAVDSIAAVVKMWL